MLFFTVPPYSFFFFFNDTATTEIYTLSLHDALPILSRGIASRKEIEGDNALEFSPIRGGRRCRLEYSCEENNVSLQQDRKSTRLNSSHSQISYAVFCLKKKKKNKTTMKRRNSVSTRD